MANISIVPLGATIGARVEGIDFSEPLTDDAIRAAIGEHKVLVFKGDATGRRFSRFRKKFGRNTSCGTGFPVLAHKCCGRWQFRSLWRGSRKTWQTVAIPKTLRNLACYTPLK